MKSFCLSRIWFSGMAVSATLAVLSASAGEQRQVDAHEHGVTVVNAALEDAALVIELESPAMNIVGFEHPPRTDEQKQAVVRALAVLETDSSLFAINSEAQCSLTDASVAHVIDAADEGRDHENHDHEEHDDGHADHDDEHDDHEAGSHAEFVGEYLFTCRQPQKLSRITVGLFAAFPLTEEVELSFLGPDTQTFRSLNAAQPALQLER